MFPSGLKVSGLNKHPVSQLGQRVHAFGHKFGEPKFHTIFIKNIVLTIMISVDDCTLNLKSNLL